MRFQELQGEVGPTGLSAAAGTKTPRTVFVYCDSVSQLPVWQLCCPTGIQLGQRRQPSSDP